MGSDAVIVLTADYAPGNWSGIGVAAAHLSDALAGMGRVVDVVMPHPAADRGSVPGGPRLHRLHRDRFPFRPDAEGFVLLHSLGLAGLAIELKNRFGLRLAYVAHALVQRELAATRATDAWVRMQSSVFAAADHVFFLNEDDRREAVAGTVDLPERSSVLPNGIPPPRPVLERPPDGPVAFVGRFTHVKGIDRFVQAARIMIARGCREHFVLAGGHGDPDGTAVVERLVADHPDRCRALGWLDQPELDRLYARAAVVLAPSRYEPFGLVALEAMRSGAPVLGSPVGGLVELLGPGSGGRLVPGTTANEWADACERLLGDRVLRATLQRQGPAFVRERYDIRVQARRLLAVLDSLAPERTP